MGLHVDQFGLRELGPTRGEGIEELEWIRTVPTESLRQTRSARWDGSVEYTVHCDPADEGHTFATAFVINWPNGTKIVLGATSWTPLPAWGQSDVILQNGGNFRVQLDLPVLGAYVIELREARERADGHGFIPVDGGTVYGEFRFSRLAE